MIPRHFFLTPYKQYSKPSAIPQMVSMLGLVLRTLKLFSEKISGEQVK